MSKLMVIFGATGDLSHKKLFPAFYNLEYEDLLVDVRILAIGRKDFSKEEYLKKIKDGIKKNSRFSIRKEILERFFEKIDYFKLDFLKENQYKELEKFIEDKNLKNFNRSYYFATSPEYFPVISKNLKNSNMVFEDTKAIIEKPFGKDLVSARKYNKEIVEIFKEENTYRIDHYLGKEMIQSILDIRFSNMMYEPIWNKNYIDNIQISILEKEGISTRGAYYDNSGALRDMVQNHIFQTLALVAMEPPKKLNAKEIRDSKVAVLKNITLYDKEDVKRDVVLGQYVSKDLDKNSYRDEKGVKKDSLTETFVALKIDINNSRWRGVPFYIRTGKSLDKKEAKIVITFKKPSFMECFNNHEKIEENKIIIMIQPKEGVLIEFNTKKQGNENQVVKRSIDFCQNCRIDSNSPEAYERLLLNALQSDPTLFTRWDELEISWKFIDRILKDLKSYERKNLIQEYFIGTSGPKEAEILLERDSKKWN